VQGTNLIFTHTHCHMYFLILIQPVNVLKWTFVPAVDVTVFKNLLH